MSHRSVLAFFFFKALATTITAVMALFVVFSVGPVVETRFFPVVSHARILDEQPTLGGDGTQLQVQFTRLRNCEYLGLAWYQRTSDGGDVRVPVQLGQPLSASSPGRLPIPATITSGPWVVPIPMASLHDGSYAVVFHRCHPLWLTTTEFYP